MISHSNIIAVATSVESKTKAFNDRDATIISYLPLAHTLERNVFNICIFYWTKIGVYSGDILKLTEDLGYLKPTIFISVPWLFNKMHDKIKAKMDKATGLKKKLIQKAINSKLKNLHHKGKYTHWFYDRLIFNKVWAIVGGKIKLMLTGSAPIS